MSFLDTAVKSHGSPIANLLENTLGGTEKEVTSSWKPGINVLVMGIVGRHVTARRPTGQFGASSTPVGDSTP